MEKLGLVETFLKELISILMMAITLVVIMVFLTFFMGGSDSVKQWMDSPISQLRVRELLFILFIVVMIASRK